MKAVIFSHLYERGRQVFEESGVEFLICPRRNETEFLSLQHRHQAGIVVLDSRPLSEGFFDSLLPQTLLIRFGTGVDNIPIQICRKHGHRIANTPGASVSSVSAYVFAVMGILSQGIWAGHREIVRRKWIRPTGRELQGKRLSVLGLGRIGLAVAETALNYHKMEVIGLCRKNRVDEKVREIQEKGYAFPITGDVEEAVFGADFISVHLNLNPDTEYLLNEKTLSYFKKEAFLINTARGKHIREVDLRTALDRGKMAGAALDVFEHEPYSPTGEEYPPDLCDLPNVILTPHIAGHTEEANRNTALLVVHNIRAFCQKRMGEVYWVKTTERG